MNDFEFFNIGREGAAAVDERHRVSTAKTYATTGKIGSGNSVTVVDTAIPSHVWVKINDNQAETKSVLNKKTGVDRFKGGTGVWLVWNADERIYEVDSVASASNLTTLDQNLLSSASSPTQAGDTKTDTTPNALIKNLRVRVLSGLIVYIEAGTYYVGATQYSWPGGTLDLTSYVPAFAGTKAPVIIGFDSTGAATAYAGTAMMQPLLPVGSPYFSVADFVTARNAATGLDAALFGIGLLYGQTAITNQADFVDLRAEQVNGSTGGGSIDTLAAVDRGLSIDATDPTNLLIATRPTDLDNADTLVHLDATLNEDVRPLRLSAGAKHVHLEDMTGMGDPDVTNPVVALGTGGASDTKIRELGNILYEPWEATRKYKMTYTGWVAGEATDEKIHYAYSEDGKTWTKYASNPIISGRRAEDPYVVKVDGVYYLFAEDKTANTISTSFIRRWHSTDFTSWTDDGQVQGIGTDAQSPLVWYDGARWYLLYEHHPTSPLNVRLAYSDDGLNFVDETSNPVFSASQTTSTWCVDTVVCDDLIKVGEQWVMSYHGQDSGAIWREGLALSRDLLTWIDSPHSPLPDYVAGIHADTMMFLYDTALTLFYEDDNVSGIYRGFPVLADSTAKTLATDVLTVDKDFHIVAAQSGTADNLATISGGKAGQLLVLRADAGDTITVKDSTGNITLGAGTDFTLSGDKSLLLYLQAGTWYDVGGTGADINPATIHASDLATRWEPLIFDSEIVFYDGDIVMVEVAN